MVGSRRVARADERRRWWKARAEAWAVGQGYHSQGPKMEGEEQLELHQRPREFLLEAQVLGEIRRRVLQAAHA